MTRKRERISFIRVDIRTSDEGLLIATSPTIPELLVIAKDEHELAVDIPDLIRALWQERYGEQVNVFPAALEGHDEPETLEAWAAVPAEIASALLQGSERVHLCG